MHHDAMIMLTTITIHGALKAQKIQSRILSTGSQLPIAVINKAATYKSAVITATGKAKTKSNTMIPVPLAIRLGFIALIIWFVIWFVIFFVLNL